MNFSQWFYEAGWNYEDDYDREWNKEWNKKNRETNARAQWQNQESLDRQTFVAYHRTPYAAAADKIMRNGFILTPGGNRSYGEGIYLAMSLNDWRDTKASEAYGDWIIAASVPGNRIVNGSTTGWQKQAIELGAPPESIGERGSYNLGAQHADIINNLAKTGKVDGVVVRGKGYGGWLVLFNPKKATPIKVAYHKGNQPLQWMKQIPPAMLQQQPPKPTVDTSIMDV